MEKLYTCVACSTRFKVLSRSDNPVYKQHEVEMNVECPFCSKTNAIVWPQDESLPLVVTEVGQPPRHQRGVEIQILRTAKQGWQYRVRMLDQDLVVRSEGGKAHVLLDDVRNSYQRVK